MYAWLSDALQGPSTVITANRRLARVLQQEYSRQQILLEKNAWESPAIFAWQDWLGRVFQTVKGQAELPARLNQHQSQLLWERCLRREVGEPYAGISNLVRLSRDAWQRMADWQVPVREIARTAQTRDQRLFAAAAGRYLGVLERQGWVDEAGLGGLVDGLMKSGRATCEGQHTFVGFDRVRPVVRSIRESLSAAGCGVRDAPMRTSASEIDLQSFDSVAAEMRAAGAWARALLEESPGRSIAIIAPGLAQNAPKMTHLLREGLVPGWQYAPASVAKSVNTSYGRKLIDYPAVSVALLWLSWLVRDLSSTEVGHLLRTPMLGSASLGGRSRLELKIRQLPERSWTPAMVSSTLRGADSGQGAAGWLDLVAELSKARRELEPRASPAAWALYINAALSACGWPGREALSSDDFQLVNRWRDSLNDLARLDLISPSMNLKTALRRLELMASDTIFQPESARYAVQLMGPLEASGAEFDAIWISGVTAAHWPPAGSPTPLVSRQLQRRKRMPDADPGDTVDYAQSLLSHLSSAANQVVCSYARHDDDAEQTPSGLLASLPVQSVAAEPDPGWHASLLSGAAETLPATDTVPAIGRDENIAGGAGAIQRQLGDPLSAFIAARLGVAYLPAQGIGLPAVLRGNIVHDALYQLYIDTPTQHAIRSWSEHEMQARIGRALDAAFARHERNVDNALAELLKLERHRIADLLRNMVCTDLARHEFAIEAVEHKLTFEEAEVRLQLRIDRIDRHDDGGLEILDYKTGAKKTLLDSSGAPKEIQLIVYALALDAEVSAVALVNVDSREISFEGAGSGYNKAEDWAASLHTWKNLVRSACRDMSAGDVRINARQGIKDARPFNLLSRYTELLRGA